MGNRDDFLALDAFGDAPDTLWGFYDQPTLIRVLASLAEFVGQNTFQDLGRVRSWLHEGESRDPADGKLLVIFSQVCRLRSLIGSCASSAHELRSGPYADQRLLVLGRVVSRVETVLLRYVGLLHAPDEYLEWESVDLDARLVVHDFDLLQRELVSILESSKNTRSASSGDDPNSPIDDDVESPFEDDLELPF